jgi:hypothetical protein
LLGDLTTMTTTITRTLRFFGQAYGDTPVTLVASINNTELFNGTVSTIAGPVPLGLILEDQVILFTVSFPGDAEGRGSFPMSVTVSGGDSVIFGVIRANYEPISTGNRGPDIFGPVFDGDARSNVAIDGIAQSDVYQDGKKVSYCWIVHNGSTLSHNLNLA